MRILLLAIAGGLGTVARYGVVAGCRSIPILQRFPMGTLVVNVVGSFLMGVVISTTVKSISKDDYFMVVGTGFLGGFTTFSAFELDTYNLLQTDQIAKCGAYVLLNVGLGFLGLLAGQFIGRRLSGQSHPA